MMTALGSGNPRKVLQKASQLGIHNDCLAADVDGACEWCVTLINSVYDFFYGHLATEEQRISAIIDDLITDREEFLE